MCLGGREWGAGACLLTHLHWALLGMPGSAVGLLPVSGRGDARVAPPCPTKLCVRGDVYLTSPYLTLHRMT